MMTGRRDNDGVTALLNSGSFLLLIKVATAAAVLAIGWRTLTRRVDDKLDAVRFERDSVRRDERWTQRDSAQSRDSRDIDLLMCLVIPPDSRCKRR